MLRRLLRAAKAALIVTLAVLFTAYEGVAATSIVTFPDLPSGTSWISGLTDIFTSAAGLGLGILGLGLVIGCIVAGLYLKKRKAG